MKTRQQKLGYILFVLGALLVVGGVICAIASEQASSRLVWRDEGVYPGYYYNEADPLHDFFKASIVFSIVIGTSSGVLLGLLGLTLLATREKRGRPLRFLHCWSYPCFALVVLGPFFESAAATKWFGHDSNNWGYIVLTMLFSALFLAGIGTASLLLSTRLFQPKKEKANLNDLPQTLHQPVFNAPPRPRSEKTVYPLQVGRSDAVLRPKSRVGFVLFALFFGALGIHNFYALRIKSAVAQLLLTLFTGVALGAVTGIAFATKWAWWLENGWLVAAIAEPVVILGVWIWSIVEICVVSRDGRGVPMQ